MAGLLFQSNQLLSWQKMWLRVDRHGAGEAKSCKSYQDAVERDCCATLGFH